MVGHCACASSHSHPCPTTICASYLILPQMLSLILQAVQCKALKRPGSCVNYIAIATLLPRAWNLATAVAAQLGPRQIHIITQAHSMLGRSKKPITR